LSSIKGVDKHVNLNKTKTIKAATKEILKPNICQSRSDILDNHEDNISILYERKPDRHIYFFSCHTSPDPNKQIESFILPFYCQGCTFIHLSTVNEGQQVTTAIFSVSRPYNMALTGDDHLSRMVVIYDFF
jgi:hypothetical protein